MNAKVRIAKRKSTTTNSSIIVIIMNMIIIIMIEFGKTAATVLIAMITFSFFL